MAIKIKDEDVYVTEDELRKYRAEYGKVHSGHAGPTPSLEDFIKGRKSLKENKETKTLLQG